MSLFFGLFASGINKAMNMVQDGNTSDLNKYLSTKSHQFINSTASNGCTLLHAACRKGMQDMVGMLLLRGAHIDALDTSGNTPLFVSLEKKPMDADIALVLIERGADVNIRGKNKRTALHLCAKSGNAQLALMLIQHGADLNAKTAVSATTLGYSQ